jgi:PAS domain S-box-containing protein
MDLVTNKADQTGAGCTATVESSLDAIADNDPEREVQRLLEAVTEEKLKLSSLLNSISDEVWFADTDRKFTLANFAGLRQFGLNSLEKLDVKEFVENLEVYRPDGTPRPVEQAPALRALTGEIIQNEDELVRTPGTGELRHRQVSSTPVRDGHGHIIGSVSVARDVTEHKRAETELRENEARFRTICDTSPLGIILTDLNLNTIYANDAQQRLCGLSAGNQFGQNWRTAVHPEDRERAIREWQEIGRTDQPFRSERRYLHKDGKIVWVSMTAAPIRDNAAVHGYVGIVEDITERRQSEEHIRRLNQELELRVVERTSELRAAVDQLETQIAERHRLEREILEISEREKSRVGQDLHDGLCQTLAGIGFLAKALKRNLEEENLPVGAAAEKADAIANLLKEAIDEARSLAAGMYPVNIEEYGIAPALEKLAADTAQRFYITCNFVCASPVALADKHVAAHVYRITQEAISNAITHGGAQTVVITLAAVGDQITLKIEDNGNGVVQNIESTGMGLKTMTYRARSIGGSIDFRQRKGRGIEVICSFPNQRESV